MTDQKNGVHPNLAAALCAAQAEFQPLEMNKIATIPTGKGTYQYGYADLSAVLAATRPALNKHGIVLTQRMEIAEHGLIINTELRHGEEVWSSQWPLAIADRPQLTGANLTYYRRYALTSMLGVAAEETDDESAADSGEQAVKRKPANLTPHTGEHPTSGKLNKTELKQMARAFRSDLEGISSSDELVGFLNDNVELTAQIMRDLPGWWYGDDRAPEVEALMKAVERRQRELREQDVTGIKPDPGEQYEAPGLTEPMP